MKNSKIKIISSLLAVFGLGLLSTLSSCKKDDPTEEVSVPAITDGSWIMTSNIITTPIGTFDEYANMDDFEKNDILTFQKDGVWVEDEGATKCKSSDPQSTTGTYTLNNKILTVFSSQDTVAFSIKTITASQLVVELNVHDSTLQIDLSAVVTYKH